MCTGAHPIHTRALKAGATVRYPCFVALLNRTRRCVERVSVGRRRRASRGPGEVLRVVRGDVKHKLRRVFARAPLCVSRLYVRARSKTSRFGVIFREVFFSESLTVHLYVP